VGAKLLAWGPVRFWRRSALNRFDGFIMGANLLATFIVAVIPGVPRRLQLIVPFIRLLRLTRVCRHIPGFSATVRSLISISPSVWQHLLLLAALLYSFAIIGMESFHGVLKASIPAVAESSFGRANYFGINFDTLPNALFIQFYLLSVNDWVTLMEGCMAGAGLSARTYFIVFWVVIVLFFFNTIIAFVTVAFGMEKARRDASALVGLSPKLLRMLPREERKDLKKKSESIILAQGGGLPILDWRGSLDGARGKARRWLLTRPPSRTDIDDALYRDRVMETFPETLSAEAQGITSSIMRMRSRSSRGLSFLLNAEEEER